MAKKMGRGKRNRIILYIVIILVIIGGGLFYLFSNASKNIEALGYNNVETAQILKACSNQLTCATQEKNKLNDEISALEAEINKTYSLTKDKYDPAFIKTGDKTLKAYRDELVTYKDELARKQVREAGFSGPVYDANGVCNVTTVDGHVIANKKYCLPSTYKPGESKEARASLDKMIADAKAQGITLVVSSGYRSYDEQVTTYNHWVSIYGEEYAQTVSAKPGYSEHQTGLAFDLNDGGACNLEECFESTEAGIWLKDNAHKYGFILRYPKGKEQITGYAYEPWHFRYVGVDVATEIYNANTTLEEYYNIK